MKKTCLSCGNEYGAGMSSCPKCGDSTSSMTGAAAGDVLEARLKSKELNDHALELFQQGKLKEAEAELRNAIAANPEHEMAYSNLGYVLIKRGKPGAAVEILEKVLALNSHHDEARRHLATAREAMGGGGCLSMIILMLALTSAFLMTVG